jgi:DNA-binding CsgD family transcriptional regulator
METLAQNDIDNLNKSVQNIYTLHNLDTFGFDTLSILNRLVPSDFPLFNLTNTKTLEIEDTSLPGSPELTPSILEAKSLYLGEHPMAKNMNFAVNGIYKTSDFASQQELHRLEGVYHQFLRVLDTEDQMFLYLPNDCSQSWDRLIQEEVILVGYILGRSQRNFTERDRLILQLLRPHLFQAHANAQKYHQLQQNSDTIQQSLDYLGVIALDTEGRVISIAPQAVTWLETYFPISTCLHQLPDNLGSWVKHQIASAKKTDIPSVYLPLRIQQAGRELTIRFVIEPSKASYLLLLEEQTLSSLNSLELLGLSQRETEVLGLIMQGKDNKSISIQMNIRIGTTRKHLENIYLKLGVQSRSEAVACALAKMGLLHSLPLV